MPIFARLKTVMWYQELVYGVSLWHVLVILTYILLTIEVDGSDKF